MSVNAEDDDDMFGAEEMDRLKFLAFVSVMLVLMTVMLIYGLIRYLPEDALWHLKKRLR